jgi:hypothetical protein
VKYGLIDLRDDLVFGPYSTSNEARSRANNLNRWEIQHDDDSTVIDWGIRGETSEKRNAN